MITPPIPNLELSRGGVHDLDRLPANVGFFSGGLVQDLLSRVESTTGFCITP